jgi:hypothetical protein
MKTRPTLAEIRSWPAAVTITVAATAYGFGRSHAYDLVARGEFPARIIRAGSRYVVVTADIIRQLSPSEQATDAA